MFDPHQKSTGTRYSGTVAFLALAFIFSPLLLILSGPPGQLSVSLAVVSSGICVALAWVNWKKHSQLTIPSLERANVRAK